MYLFWHKIYEEEKLHQSLLSRTNMNCRFCGRKVRPHRLENHVEFNHFDIPEAVSVLKWIEDNRKEETEKKAR
jgi:hypothetical protein